MSECRDPGHAEMMARLSAAEGRDGDRARLLACADCSREVAELDALQAALDAEGGMERAVLAAQEDEALLASDRAALAALRRRVMPVRRRAPWIPIAVAAAALLAIAFVWKPWRHAEPSGIGETLGGTTLDLVPRGRVAAFGSFAFRCELPPGGSFHIRILDSQGNLLLESPPLNEPRWTPSAEALQTLPDRILWDAEAWSAFHDVVRRDRAEVLRSP